MIRAWSRLLNETVVCLEDDEIAPMYNAGVQYTRSELVRLDGLDAEAKQAAHLLKKTFGGKYLGNDPG